MSDPITFFHAPQSRSSGVAVLLDELGAPYDMHVVNMKAGEQRMPTFLAVNPMGKVPAIRHGHALVTEQVAITIFLPDLFPAAGLAPAFNAADRGPYLRWIAFYGSCFEPAIVDKTMKRDPAPLAMSPYGSIETVMDTLLQQLRAGPYLLGERFSAADILWGGALQWITQFGLVPKLPEIVAYIDRVTGRPSFGRVKARDAELAAAHAAALPVSA